MSWGPFHQMIFIPWWRHQMGTSSALLALCVGNSPVTGEFPWQRPVTWSFDAFFDLRLNKRSNNQDAGDLRRHRAHYDLTVMHISSVIKISFCRISFSGHQNKFCTCLDSIYGSRVILVMCKNCSDIRWHRLNSNQSKTNCPKDLNSDGLIVREMGPWPECIFRSLLQFLVIFIYKSKLIKCIK